MWSPASSLSRFARTASLDRFRSAAIRLVETGLPCSTIAGCSLAYRMTSIPLATAPSAYYGGQPVQPIPPRSGLQLTGEVATPPPQRVPPELTTATRTLPGQVGGERIFGPRPTPAVPIPPRSGLMLSGEVEPQAAALGRLPVTGARSVAETGEALRHVPVAPPPAPWYPPRTATQWPAVGSAEDLAENRTDSGADPQSS
jgi:hypothetical protein